MAMELFERSPMRALSQSVRGGLNPGELGVVMARAGVGKTALLVHIALGHLLQGTEVLHISLGSGTAQVRAYYDEILGELARTSGVDVAEARVAVEQSRRIHSVQTDEYSPDHLTHLLAMLDEVMGFRPTVVVIDGGMNAFNVDPELWSTFARDAHLRVWVAVQVHREAGPGFDELAKGFDTAVMLEPNDNAIELTVLRAGGHIEDESTLRLNPQTNLLEDDSILLETEFGVASPAPETVSLFSGGTTGAECAFGEEAEAWGLQEVNFTFDGHRQVRTRGSVVLSTADLDQGTVSMRYVEQRLQRSWDAEGVVAKVLASQWHLVSRARQVFILGVLQPDGTVTGGTGWAAELARRWNKPVWVYCQNKDEWRTWTGDAWVIDEPVITTTEIAATGTRFVTGQGRDAVADLFKRSFGDA